MVPLFALKIQKALYLAVLNSILCCAIAIFVSSFHAIEKLELRLLDDKINSTIADSLENSDVVIIGITDNALDEVMEKFPWPRSHYAHIIDNLTKAGAKVIAFDLIFMDKGVEKENQAFRDIAKKSNNVVVAGREKDYQEFKFIDYKNRLDYQTIFSNDSGITVGNVYIRQDNDGIYRRYHPSSQNRQGDQFLSFSYATLKKYFSLTPPNDTVSRVSERMLNFAGKNIPTWWDGNSILINFYNSERTFPIVSAENILDDKRFISSTEYNIFKSILESGNLDSLSLLREENRDLWEINIFDDPLANIQDIVKGKICLIGPMFPESKDIFPTPIWYEGNPSQNGLFGIEIHAAAVQNFLDGNFTKTISMPLLLLIIFAFCYIILIILPFIREISYKGEKKPYKIIPPNFLSILIILVSIASFFYGDLFFIPLSVMLASLGASLFLSTVMFYALMYKGYPRSLAMDISKEVLSISFILALFLIVSKLALYLFSEKKIFLPTVPVLTASISCYVLSIVYQYFYESKEKRVIKKFFSAYVPKTLVNQMISNPSMFKLGGERRRISVLFCDIIGFTHISESFHDSPEVIVDFLNEYLGEMTAIIFKYKGTLDKYIGDSIVAFWNAPVQIKDHPKASCWAAIEMQKRLNQLRKKWKEEKKPQIHARIGINTGIALVGNIGSSQRFDYTAMGDTVNVASRLEAANKKLNTSIIVSEQTNSFIKKSCITRELATIKVQGKDKPMKVFELIGKKTPGQTYTDLLPSQTTEKGIIDIPKN